MPVTVRVYAYRTYDALLKVWSKSKTKGTLKYIASLACAEPILHEWEDVERPTDEEMARNNLSHLIGE